MAAQKHFLKLCCGTTEKRVMPRKVYCAWSVLREKTWSDFWSHYKSLKPLPRRYSRCRDLFKCWDGPCGKYTLGRSSPIGYLSTGCHYRQAWYRLWRKILSLYRGCRLLTIVEFTEWLRTCISTDILRWGFAVCVFMLLFRITRDQYIFYSRLLRFVRKTR